ncbi:MAG: GIY-YIG nuclease family protein, partial [Bacteroidota bacterium]
MKYYVYILYSPSADRYYVGQSHDPKARLKEHNHGDRPNQSTKYTFKHRPWELKVSFVAGNSRAEAMKIERYIKRQKSRQFIQALIEAHPDEEQFAQLLRV